MKFTFNREGKKEDVAVEKWIWGVVYKDGTELLQFETKGDEGVFHQIGEVDQSEVKRFILAKAQGGQSICILVPEGAKLIHKYKNDVFLLSKEKISCRTYVFGYKLKDQYFLNYVLPNDTIVQSNDPNLRLTDEGFIKVGDSASPKKV